MSPRSWPFTFVFFAKSFIANCAPSHVNFGTQNIDVHPHGHLGSHRGRMIRSEGSHPARHFFTAPDEAEAHFNERQRNAIELEMNRWAPPSPAWAQDFIRQYSCAVSDDMVSGTSSDALPKVPPSDETKLSQLIAEASESFTKPVVLTFWHDLGSDFPQDNAILTLFACRMRRLGIKPLVYCLTHRDKQQIQNIPGLLPWHSQDFALGVRRLFGIPDHVDGTCYHKWSAALLALSAGAPGVFVSDLDVMWLRDPRPYLTSMKVDFAASLDDQMSPLMERNTLEHAQSIILGVQKARDGKGMTPCCSGGLPLNAGQAFANGNMNGQKVLRAIIATHHHLVHLNKKWDPTKVSCGEDQAPMQWGVYQVCQGTMACRVLDPRLFMNHGEIEESLAYPGAPFPYSVHTDTDNKLNIVSRLAHALNDTCAIDHFEAKRFPKK